MIERDHLVEIRRGFASPDECAALTAHFLADDKHFQLGYERQRDRVKRKLRTNNRHRCDYQYPPGVWSMRERIVEGMGLKGLLPEETGTEGVVVSITKPGGDVFRHIDGLSRGRHVRRCNVQISGRSVVVVESTRYHIETGDLMSYVVSKHEHHVEEVPAGDARVLIMFGFEVGT